MGVVCGVFLLGGGKAVVGDGSPWESLLVCVRWQRLCHVKADLVHIAMFLCLRAAGPQHCGIFFAYFSHCCAFRHGSSACVHCVSFATYAGRFFSLANERMLARIVRIVWRAVFLPTM